MRLALHFTQRRVLPLVILFSVFATIAAAGDYVRSEDMPEEIIFTQRTVNMRDGHWYANFGYYAHGEKFTGKFGRLSKLNMTTKKVTDLLSDPEGAIRDPQVHYSGEKILFSWRPGTQDDFDLYEINIDGSGLKQLTSDEWDDIEPTYLPDGGIAFVSNRCKRWVPCYVTQVATIYRMDGDGQNIRPLSANVEHDNHPWMLEDGRMIYTRWEYSDRSMVQYHHLWTMNPDGTRQMIYFGNQHPGRLFIDAKPIPGTQQVVFIDSPKHGRRDHMGSLAVVHPGGGPDSEPSESLIAEGNFRDPWPLSPTQFLVAENSRLLRITRDGKREILYTLPKDRVDADIWLHEPRPVMPRNRERSIPDFVDLTQETGTIIVNNSYTGRNMDGIEPGAIKKMLILEHLAMPISFSGGMEPISYGGSYFINRILGTVPVEADGSIHAEVPANTPLVFVLLDGQDLAVKRMQSFCTVMPGETVSCVGCHEDRVKAPENQPVLQATLRSPSNITSIADMPDIFDYPRDIQPIWDEHCLGCHDVDKRAGGVLLTDDQGPIVTHSYFMLTTRLQMADGRNLARSNYPPYKLGSAASYLLQKVDGSHHGVKVSDHEFSKIKLWIDASATFAGTYAALGSGMFGGEMPYAKPFPKTWNKRDAEWPVAKAAGEAIDRRCGSCHTDDMQLPRFVADHMGLKIHHMPFYGRDEWSWVPPWVREFNDTRPGSREWAQAHLDPRNFYSHNILFNLSRPDKSVMLLAPLAKSAGGYGACGEAVFNSTKDADYQAILRSIEAGKVELNRITRFNMPNFVPAEEYIREMKRYGILPVEHDAATPVDVYALERKYWQALRAKPVH